MSKVLICAAWPYANSPIHLGHIAGSLLSPDIFSRYNRLKGNEVLMVSGSDQHGTPITVKADREGVTPKEIAERYHEINKKAIEGMGIEFSLFTKTHTENHAKIVSEIFLSLLDKGYLIKKSTPQYYCPHCMKFLPDRYVEGVCPICGNEKARGDQCEKCGNTFESGGLNDAKCVHCSTTPEMKETEHFFLKLSEFQKPLTDWLENKQDWKNSVQLFTKNWLDEGLHDRAITRDMSWGIPVPLENWEGKSIYVWFEAVIGYLSASIEWAKKSGNPDAWKDYWTDPEVKSYYFLGKDNIPFHTIIWPAILMAYGGLNMPYDVPANEFLTFKGDKMSKSRGMSIDIPSMLEKYDSDSIRYYASINMPENKDADFSWSEFVTKNNNELVATLGNFYHRSLSFTHKHFGEIPEYKGSAEEEEKISAAISAAAKEVEENLDKCEFKRALKAVMELAQFGNRYFDACAPWALIKKDKEECGSALNLNLRLVKALAILSNPFLPRSSKGAWNLLGYDNTIYDEGWKSLNIPPAEHQKLRSPAPLFTKMEPIEEETNKFGGFSSLNLKVGKIVSVDDHPNADSLFLLQVDIGHEIQVVAGLKKYYSKEEMLNRRVVVVSNLKPAKLRGCESQGMLLAADAGEELVMLLSAPEESEPGEAVNSGLPQNEKRIEFKDFQKLTLRIGSIQGNKVDIGRGISADVREGDCGKVAVFLPSEDSDEGLILRTESGRAVSVGSEMPNGANIR